MEIGQFWDGERLSIPERLGAAYAAVLDKHGFLNDAKGPRPDEAPVGGVTQEQTDKHFTHAFDGSVARVELILVNPRGETSVSSTLLYQFLAGGSLCLVDVPSGAGAGALTLLASIAELRASEVLPRQPLEVRLLWGEISQPALNYGLELLNKINPVLEEQAIFVSVDSFRWDVLDDVSNVELVQKIAQAKLKFPQVLLLVCNFSGFLERQGKWKAANEGLGLLVRFCSGDMNAGVWIEPDQKAVSKGLFGKLSKLFRELLEFARLVDGDEEGAASSARFACPLGTGRTHRVNARALPFELAIKREKE
ncbi:hypothetical protein [Citromicrobium sp. JLT1363]|uniref:hypothetical protein n=1 Tax=Citromicrobium sp. JLT1363 TaxID=517722 RepID=UPI000225E9A6|nr:hypothetical protein [Citromicrobium sp. JLT1363]